MSRGPGAVQRAVVAELAQEETGWLSGWVTVRDLAARIYLKPTRSNLESVRRAVKKLEAGGVLETDLLAQMVKVSAARVDHGDHLCYRRLHYGDRVQLEARLSVSVEQREAENEHYRALVDRLVALDAEVDL